METAQLWNVPNPCWLPCLQHWFRSLSCPRKKVPSEASQTLHHRKYLRSLYNAAVSKLDTLLKSIPSVTGLLGTIAKTPTTSPRRLCGELLLGSAIPVCLLRGVLSRSVLLWRPLEALVGDFGIVPSGRAETVQRGRAGWMSNPVLCLESGNPWCIVISLS